MERRLDFLNKERIIYRRDPITDIPTEVYDWGNYYENGTYQCYTLFNSKAKITSYKSFKWHLLTLWYLNPNHTKEDMLRIALVLRNKDNGFTTFNISNFATNRMIEEVYLEPLDDPPRNRLRKIIFKDNCKLTLSEKISIVGTMVGKHKRITKDNIYDSMLNIHENNKKITFKALAKAMNCSIRTLHRNMGSTLKNERLTLNK
jgi:hypothetical protein